MNIEFTAEAIATVIGGEVVGNKDVKVSRLSSIEQGSEGSLTYLTNPKYESCIYETAASIIIVDKSFEPTQAVASTLIKVESAGAALLQLLEIYNAAMNQKRTGISAMTSISESAKLDKEELYVGDFAVIEDGAEVAKGCQIYPQCYIGKGVTIGENTTLYAGVKIYAGCHIGSNCIIHAGAVIGADGFGFMPNAEGGYDKIPQLGNVVIEDFVEIGANTCVDRAKTDSTIIRRGVKLDNLIQVGHNVVIGENTVSSAQMGIAGSSSIGKGCMVGGQVGIADHVHIGDNCRIGSKSGIDKSVPAGEVRLGYPALPGIQFHRSMAALKDLPQTARTVREHSATLAKLTSEE